MLSRVADNLFWMNRYVERAESMSRMVEVNLDTQLEAPDHFLGKKFWNPAIQALSAIDFFKLEETERVEMFFLFSRQWPSSTQNCIFSARENARMVRDQLSEEIWVELNSIYHFFQSGDAEKQYLETPRQFFKRIIRFSLVFQGLSDATVHHDEGWRFMSLGKYLERADQTSRALDALTYKNVEPSRTDLIATLRTCSALSAYRKQFRGELSLGNVADFLLFSQDFPRSLRFAIRRIDTYLHEISGVPSGNFSNEAERLAGSALAKVNFTNINAMLEVGLHRSIDELQCLLIELGQRIFESYVMLPFTTESMSVKAAAQAQVQQ
jgi:uncharacterized alpha-E superfamily protein